MRVKKTIKQRSRQHPHSLTAARQHGSALMGPYYRCEKKKQHHRPRMTDQGPEQLLHFRVIESANGCSSVGKMLLLPVCAAPIADGAEGVVLAPTNKQCKSEDGQTAHNQVQRASGTEEATTARGAGGGIECNLHHAFPARSNDWSVLAVVAHYPNMPAQVNSNEWAQQTNTRQRRRARAHSINTTWLGGSAGQCSAAFV